MTAVAPNWSFGKDGKAYPRDGKRTGPAWQEIWRVLSDGLWHDEQALEDAQAARLSAMGLEPLMAKTVRNLLLQAENANLILEIGDSVRTYRRWSCPRLCLFDLDQTLVDTHDIEELRLAGIHRTDAAYCAEIQRELDARDRRIIDEEFLLSLQEPETKLGIFTRSPRRYVDTLLQHVFPRIQWATVIAYEDVASRKPNGQGIYQAMQNVGMLNISNPSDVLPAVVMVGDSDVDVRAAYHAGCPTVLFKRGWPHPLQRTHWRSMELMPDAIAGTTDELRAAISDPVPRLPYLEYLLAGGRKASHAPRFDRLGKFFPNEKTPHFVYTAGRMFAGYQTLEKRREWHRLSQSIHENKDTVQFPNEWVMAIQRFIAVHYKPDALSQALAEYLATLEKVDSGDSEMVITCIPARQGRIHRLGHLVSQLAAAYGATPRVGGLLLSFDSEVLAFRPGVRSQSREHLNRVERFANVCDHLYVANPSGVAGRKFLVVDDVSTTGATLLYAKRRLLEAGAESVDCFSLAQDISDPLRQS